MNEPSTKPKTITAEEFDRLVDAGEDVAEYLDLSTLSRPGHELLHVQLLLPFNVLLKVEQEAVKRGMTREALMATWITEKVA